ncbi:MAG: antirestriction protein ArdA [Wenzhouxiangellaceae bacterium]
MTKTTDTPKVYIADLAAYNAGYHRGIWIDATDDLDTIRDDIQNMLEHSPVFGAGDYAIHDYEGFGGIRLSEHTGMADVVALAEFLEEHPEFGAALLSYWDEDIHQATEALEDYVGTYDTLADFAQELTEESTMIPKHLEYYIDYDRMARDLEMSGDVYTLEGDGGQTHVFWSR